MSRLQAPTDVGGDAELAELTLSGEVLGSPTLMAPEQAQGRHALVGPASDLYS